MTADGVPTPRLHDRGRKDRRSVADAVEILRLDGGFSEAVSAVIRTAPITLPTDGAGSLVQLVCGELGIVVTLPTSNAFTGRNTAGETIDFDIAHLNGASVNARGVKPVVKLIEGTSLTAVTLSPVRQMRGLNERDWRILYGVIAFADLGDHCFLHVDKEKWPDWKYVDFHALQKAEIFGLKDLVTYLLVKRGFQVSEQTVANTLNKCGIKHRHRKAGATFPPHTI